MTKHTPADPENHELRSIQFTISAHNGNFVPCFRPECHFCAKAHGPLHPATRVLKSDERHTMSHCPLTSYPSEKNIPGADAQRRQYKLFIYFFLHPPFGLGTILPPLARPPRTNLAADDVMPPYWPVICDLAGANYRFVKTNIRDSCGEKFILLIKQDWITKLGMHAFLSWRLSLLNWRLIKIFLFFNSSRGGRFKDLYVMWFNVMLNSWFFICRDKSNNMKHNFENLSILNLARFF